MRVPFALCVLGLAMTAVPAGAQAPYGAPRGSYERHCTDIRMDGQFLSATCRGQRGAGRSSLNVQSCASDIGVDAEGGLVCTGPGAAPGAYPPPGAAYDGDRWRDDDRRGRYSRDAVVLFGGRNGRGPSVEILGPTPNLAPTGLNDRVGSIRLEPRSGPWIVCTDADYRGRCTTVDRSVSDTRRLGMRGAISSLRPADWR